MRHSMGSMPARLLVCIWMMTFIAAVVGVPAQASGRTVSPTVKAANRVDLMEVGHLRLSKEEGSEISERGQASGTYDAPVTAAFTIHPKSVTVVFTIYPRGGSIKGTAYANYKIVDSLGYFGGTFTLGRGTGKYRHASEVDGKALGFSGIINRNTFEVEVKAKGEINL
jgi:hypothetical protein